MDLETREREAAKAGPDASRASASRVARLAASEPSSGRDAGAESTREWLAERIDGRLAVAVGIGWLVAYQLAAALEPVTHKPEPWFGVLLGVAFLGLLAGTATGLVMQRRWGLLVSLAAAGFFTALSIACPVSGHHPFGTWWFGQMACALGMLAFSWIALGRPASVSTTETTRLDA